MVLWAAQKQNLHAPVIVLMPPSGCPTAIGLQTLKHSLRRTFGLLSPRAARGPGGPITKDQKKSSLLVSDSYSPKGWAGGQAVSYSRVRKRVFARPRPSNHSFRDPVWD